MKKLLVIICSFLTAFSGISSRPSALFANEAMKEEVAQGGEVFIDYQNYNHGYCPDCDCAPCKCTRNPGSCPGSCAPPAAPCAPPPPACAPTPPACAPAPCAPKAPCAPAAPCAAPACAAPAAPCAPAPCGPAPCAPVCGTECGISICALGIGLAALITAAVLIISSGDGSTSHD